MVIACEKVKGCGPPEFNPVNPVVKVSGFSSALKVLLPMGNASVAKVARVPAPKSESIPGVPVPSLPRFVKLKSLLVIVKASAFTVGVAASKKTPTAKAKLSLNN